MADPQGGTEGIHSGKHEAMKNAAGTNIPAAYSLSFQSPTGLGNILQIDFVDLAEMCQEFLGKFLFNWDPLNFGNIAKDLNGFDIGCISIQALSPRKILRVIIVGVVVPEFDL